MIGAAFLFLLCIRSCARFLLAIAAFMPLNQHRHRVRSPERSVLPALNACGVPALRVWRRHLGMPPYGVTTPG